MSPHGYEELDHPADLALKVWGEDFASVLQQAINGMTALMGVRMDFRKKIEKTLSIPEGTHEEVLVDLLSEILYIMEQDGSVLSSFVVVGEAPLILRGEFHTLLSVERWIKAVTFHDLDLVIYQDRMEAMITFDV